jgi:hypothetical protein
MLKFVSIVSGLLTFGVIASSSLARTFPHQTPRPGAPPELYGQRLIPIKKSVDLKAIIINTQPATEQKPNSQKSERLVGGFKNERARIACQQELLNYQRIHRPNERPDPSIPHIGKSDNLDTSKGCQWQVSW